VIIENIKIRTYDQRIRGSVIGLDYMGSTDPDLYSTNVVELDENARYSDTMKPLPFSNVSYTKNGNELTLFWDNSPDLDVIGSIVRVNKNGSFRRDYMNFTS